MDLSLTTPRPARGGVYAAHRWMRCTDAVNDERAVLGLSQRSTGGARMAEPAGEAQAGEAEAAAQLTLEPLTPPSQAASGALAGKMEAVCVAAMRGELQALQAALELAKGESGYSINAQGSSGRTALYQACLGRRPEIVKYLLELGAVRFSAHRVAVCRTWSDETRCDAADRRRRERIHRDLCHGEG